MKAYASIKILIFKTPQDFLLQCITLAVPLKMVVCKLCSNTCIALIYHNLHIHLLVQVEFGCKLICLLDQNVKTGPSGN